MSDQNNEKTYTQAEFDAALAAQLESFTNEKKALSRQIVDHQLDLALIHNGLKPGAKKFLAWQYEQDMNNAKDKVDVATWFAKQAKNEAMVDVIDGFRLPKSPIAAPSDTAATSAGQDEQRPADAQMAQKEQQKPPEAAPAIAAHAVIPPPPAPSDTRGSIQLTPEQIAKMDGQEFESMLPTIIQSISNNIN